MQGDEQLLELQAIDTAVDRLRSRRQQLESGTEANAARADADAAENVLGELGLRIDALSRDQQRIEHEVDTLSQKAAAEERRLYDGSIANTKELESLQREIENVRRRRSDREDELLGLMEEREGLEANAAVARSESDRLRARAEEISSSGATELEAIAAELTSLEQRREPVAAKVDAELLELYQDLRAQKKGVGVAELVDGVCQGCHEKLSAMEMDRIKHTDRVRRCEHCRRIVVLR